MSNKFVDNFFDKYNIDIYDFKNYKIKYIIYLKYLSEDILKQIFDEYIKIINNNKEITQEITNNIINKIKKYIKEDNYKFINIYSDLKLFEKLTGEDINYTKDLLNMYNGNKYNFYNITFVQLWDIIGFINSELIMNEYYKDYDYMYNIEKINSYINFILNNNEKKYLKEHNEDDNIIKKFNIMKINYKNTLNLLQDVSNNIKRNKKCPYNYYNEYIITPLTNNFELVINELYKSIKELQEENKLLKEELNKK